MSLPAKTRLLTRDQVKQPVLFRRCRSLYFTRDILRSHIGNNDVDLDFAAPLQRPTFKASSFAPPPHLSPSS